MKQKYIDCPLVAGFLFLGSKIIVLISNLKIKMYSVFQCLFSLIKKEVNKNTINKIKASSFSCSIYFP